MRTWTTILLVVAANQDSCEFRVSRSYDYIANNLGPSVHFQLASYPRAIVEIVWNCFIKFKLDRWGSSSFVKAEETTAQRFSALQAIHGSQPVTVGFQFLSLGLVLCFLCHETGSLERAVELQSRVHWFFQRYTLNPRLTTENEGNFEDNMFSSGWTSAVLTHPCFLLTLGEISGQRSAVPDSTSLCRNSFFSPSRTQWPLKCIETCTNVEKNMIKWIKSI